MFSGSRVGDHQSISEACLSKVGGRPGEQSQRKHQSLAVVVPFTFVHAVGEYFVLDESRYLQSQAQGCAHFRHMYSSYSVAALGAWFCLAQC